MLSQASLLGSRISQVFSRGSIFFTEDLSVLIPDIWSIVPDERSLRCALSDMAQEGTVIVRLSRGVYCYPREDSRMRRLLPSPEEIASALAARWKVSICPCGAYAAYLSGLTSLAEGELTFLSSGQRQVFHLQNGRTINFVCRKSVKVFSMVSPEFRNLVEGLRWVGKDRVGESELQAAAGVLRKLDRSSALHDYPLAPAWIREVILLADPGFLSRRGA